MAETWTVSPDGTSATVVGRQKIAFLQKLNVIWWFGNDAEQTADEAPWYMPARPEWLRQVMWGIRNPLQNFRCFVIGVQDRDYTVIGKAPVLTVQRDDLAPPEMGWQTSTIHLPIPRPFASYCGKRIVFYIGTQPTGIFGIKVNFR